MATAKANKKVSAIAMDLPECPVCMETMTAPIFQCQSGHSLCNNCTQSLVPPVCPICRQAMTQMRNWQLEDIVHKAKVPCPNKSFGCVYTMINADVEDHLKECIFREMECPLGAVFGKCSWRGKVKEMMDHFKERHEEYCNASSDSDIVLDNINVKEDDRHFFMVSQGKMLFIITFKLDTLQKMAYWTVQHIGSKLVAKQHIYEIHVTSNQDQRRKVVYIEHCFNDSIKADEVFRLGKCAVLPLDYLSHFVKDKKLTFRFFIKRLPGPAAKGKPEKGDGNNDNNSANHGPNPKGPAANQGPGPKGPGPKGPGPKGPGPKQGGPKGHPGPGPKSAKQKAKA